MTTKKNNGNNKTVVGRYIFLDIVSYSHNRTVEAQSDIIDVFNKIVKDALHQSKILEKQRILIPTGDGVCIALLNMNEPFDVHMEVALKVLELLSKYNQSEKDEMRQFQVRIGINENTDNLIIDINGNKNVAGAGITEAQRIMDQGEPNTILVGHTVYNHLYQREKYINKFKEYTVIVKHKKKMEVYQYLDLQLDFLGSEEVKAGTLFESIKSHTGKLKDKIMS